MNIIQKAQQLVFVVHDNVTLLDHLDVSVLLPKDSLSLRAVHCSSEERLNLLRGKSSAAAVCDESTFVSFVRRELNEAQRHVKAHWHLRGSPPQRRLKNPPPSRSFLLSLMGKRCPTLNNSITIIHSNVKPTFCLCKRNILFMRI